MKKRNWDFKNSSLAIFIPVILIVFFVGCWVGNLIKLIKCDFASPYKSEVIHTVGVIIPPVSMATVWID